MNYDLTNINSVAICDKLILKFNHKRIKAENTKLNLEQSLREMHEFSKALPALLNIVLDVIGSYKNNLHLIPKGKDRDKVQNELHKYQCKYSRLQKKKLKCSPEVLYEQQHQIKELSTEMSDCDEQLELLRNHRALLVQQEQNTSQATGVEFSSNVSISAPDSVQTPDNQADLPRQTVIAAHSITNTDLRSQTELAAHTHTDADLSSQTHFAAHTATHAVLHNHTALSADALPEESKTISETPEQPIPWFAPLALPISSSGSTDKPLNIITTPGNPAQKIIQLPKLNSSGNPVSKTA